MSKIAPQNTPTIHSAEDTPEALLEPNADAAEVAEASDAGKAKASDAYGKKGLLSADNKNIRSNTINPEEGALGVGDIGEENPAPAFLRTNLNSGLTKIMNRSEIYFSARGQKLLNASANLFGRFDPRFAVAKANAQVNPQETFELSRSGHQRSKLRSLAEIRAARLEASQNMGPLNRLTLGSGGDDVGFDGGASYADWGNASFQWVDLSGMSELWSGDGVNAGEFEQGTLGDCYFISALAAMAANDPDALEDMIQDNGDGTYTVTFHGLEYDENGFAIPSGETFSYEIDAEVLLSENYDIVGANIQDADGDDLFEIGPALLEKAFAMFAEEMNGMAADNGQLPFFGDADATNSTGFNLLDEGGDPSIAMIALTGSESWSVGYSGDYAAAFENWAAEYNLTSDELLLDILSSADEGVTVTVGTNNPEMDGLADGHAYTVLGVVEIDGEEYIVMRNPWGVGEPSGNGDDDGIFMVTLDEFKENFPVISFDVGTWTNNPNSSSIEHNSVVGALTQYSEAVLGETPPYVDPDAQEIVETVGEQIGGDWSGLEYDWTNFCTNFFSSDSGPVDVNALVQWVLREAYMENTKDLHFYAQKVQYFNEVKKALREELTRARDTLTANAGNEDTDALVAGHFVGNDVNTEAFGEIEDIVSQGTGTVVTTKAELDTYIQKMEETLNSVGDDAQLANVDLQNMLQKQQQTLQMQSNISKMLHDTAMAVIRKIGG